MDIDKKRKQAKGDSQMIPKPVENNGRFVQVDVTWGKIQPMAVADGVRTVDEFEMMELIENGGQVIDSRTPEFHMELGIPGAINIPYDNLKNRMGELDQSRPAIFFCNGPQCTQSPSAIQNLLEAGYPPGKILYYRGGIHV